MTTTAHTPSPWDAEGATIFYSAPDEADAVEMIEIRANVTEDGWDTVAFVEAIWPNATANARLIAAAPVLLDALQLCEELLSNLAPLCDLARFGDGATSVSALSVVRAVIAGAKGDRI